MNKQPLFATLLESQTDLVQVSAGVAVGQEHDVDASKLVTNVLVDQLTTSPLHDGMAVTLAYPSDSDTLDPRDFDVI